jgi:lipid A ethanolaminephosphotransferase
MRTFSFSVIKQFWQSLITFATQNRSLLLVVMFIMLTGNLSLFKRLLAIYPLNLENTPFLLSLAAFFTITTVMFFLMICHDKASRWVLAFYLFAASQAAYYMDQFGVIIDTVMIDNILQTNPQEFAGLVTSSLLLRTLFLGVLPAWLVIRYYPKNLQQTSIRSKLRSVGVLIILLILIVTPFTAGYAGFIREHKITRMYANPTYFTYSVINYLLQFAASKPVKLLTQTAEDAQFVSPHEKHELVILVVGETARADRFSLNGYKRLTNPELAKENVLSLSNVSSCGTSTSVSVPCMFSVLTRKEFDKEKALHMENALDVLAEHGVEVLWRDNNSDSKGVATRLTYEDFKSPTLNPVCQGECRDIGMLTGLDAFIAAKQNKDILIVLHQMGNHGPEYYRRYPKAFERFKPICMTGELRDCSQEEVDNAYDNAILYTDYFLANVIKLLKKYDANYETAMLYVSDHGESLGEHGFYLHAAPYMIAPKEQTHIPAIVWLGEHFDYKLAQLTPYQDVALSHDDLFCTLLAAYELGSKTCEGKKELLMQNVDIKALASLNKQ